MDIIWIMLDTIGSELFTRLMPDIALLCPREWYPGRDQMRECHWCDHCDQSLGMWPPCHHTPPLTNIVITCRHYYLQNKRKLVLHFDKLDCAEITVRWGPHTQALVIIPDEMSGVQMSAPVHSSVISPSLVRCHHEKQKLTERYLNNLVRKSSFHLDIFISYRGKIY